MKITLTIGPDTIEGECLGVDNIDGRTIVGIEFPSATQEDADGLWEKSYVGFSIALPERK